MKYFLPYWEDRIDPHYDFISDKFSPGHKDNPYQNDKYGHQILNPAPYDGILFSLGVFKSKISLRDTRRPKLRGFYNIKDYLKVNETGIEVMGDCGAFTYVNEKEPPQPFFSVENVARLYESLGFDYGVSVDHLVLDYLFVKENGKRKKIPLSKKEKERRIKLTLENAEKFLKTWKDNGYHFTPIGVAQGYDLKTYKRSVKKLAKMKYKTARYEYIGIGGLVQYRTEYIKEILTEIYPIVEKYNLKLHLFGVLRPEALSDFKKFGVVSFDSASYFRKAWLRSGNNYLSLSGKWYAAIRIPYSKDPRMTKNGKLNGYTNEDLKKMEQEAINAIIKYDHGELTLDETLEKIIAYDRLLLRNTENIDKLKEKYKETLKDKPWKSCTCDICRTYGVHVIIFRGATRNKLRGFHNVWVFKNVLQPKYLKHQETEKG